MPTGCTVSSNKCVKRRVAGSLVAIEFSENCAASVRRTVGFCMKFNGQVLGISWKLFGSCLLEGQGYVHCKRDSAEQHVAA